MMNRDQAEEFLKRQRQAILATTRADGRPQLSNVLSAYDEESCSSPSRRTGPSSETYNAIRALPFWCWDPILGVSGGGWPGDYGCLARSSAVAAQVLRTGGGTAASQLG
jgi:hypothetical protein